MLCFPMPAKRLLMNILPTSRALLRLIGSLPAVRVLLAMPSLVFMDTLACHLLLTITTKTTVQARFWLAFPTVFATFTFVS